MQATPGEERRLTTILFADLSGFTSVSAGMDPEDVRDMANACFESMNAAIQQHAGTIHKYGGDLVIALFGIPSAHEDDPEQAVGAALDMMKSLPEMNRKLSAILRKPTNLGLHIGISSGIVIVGHVGTAAKSELTVMGEIVNLASRLKDAAKPGEILVSESVFRASRYMFDYEAHPPIKLKGIEQEVNIYRPKAVKARPEPKRGITGLSAPMIGRDRELAQFQEAVQGLAGGPGKAVFVLGDAGLGKSRLLSELKGWLARGHLAVPPLLLEGRCLSYGEALPYWPFLSILRGVFGISDNDMADEVRKKIQERCKLLTGDHWPELVPYFGYIFSVSFGVEGDEKVRYLDPHMLQLQIMISTKRLLTELAKQQPILLVIEDYHWIDAASLALLEFLVDGSGIGSLMVIGLCRIDKEKLFYKTKDKLCRRMGARGLEITLKPLDSSQSDQLLTGLLNIRGFPAEVKQRIIGKAEGNPFYLEEIIRSLIDRGVVSFDDGAWCVKSAKTDIQIPDTVQALTAARVDQLDAEAKEVLLRASVIGRSFPARLLEALSGIDSLMLSLHLATLDEHAYIRVARTEPELEYIFQHPITQEVVYNSLPRKRRRELHQQTAEMIERLYAARLEEFTERLAHHYANSDNLDRAIELLLKAGERSRQRYANDEAIGYFREVMRIIDERGEAAGRHERPMWTALEALGDVYKQKSEYLDALTSFAQLYEASRSDKMVQSRAKRKQAEALLDQGGFEAALAAAAEAEKILTGDSPAERIEKAEIRITSSWAFRIKGDVDQAVSEAEQGLLMIQSLEGGQDLGSVETLRLRVKGALLSSLGVSYYTKNDLEKPLALYQESLAISEQCANKQAAAAAYGNLGIVYRKKGEFARAVESFQRGLSISEQIGDRQKVGIALGNLGVVERDLGNAGRALDLFKKYLEIAEEVGDRQRIGIAAGNVAVVFFDAGDYDAARPYFTRAYDLAVELDDTLGIIMTGLDLGLLYEEQGEYDRAIEIDERALELARKMNDDFSIGTACLNLGHIAMARSDAEVARQRLAEGKEFSKKAAEKLEREGDKTNLFLVYTNLVRTEIDLDGIGKGSVSTALPYLERAHELARMTQSKSGLANCALLSAIVSSSTGNFGAAHRGFEEAIGLYAEVGQKRNLADSCLEYGKSLMREDGEEARREATARLEQALTLCESMKLLPRIAEIRKLLNQLRR